MSKGLERALKVVADENGDLLKYKRAFEIIKNKKVNVKWLFNSEDVEDYNKWYEYHLTQEEYDLLKEMLK